MYGLGGCGPIDPSRSALPKHLNYANSGRPIYEGGFSLRTWDVLLAAICLLVSGSWSFYSAWWSGETYALFIGVALAGYGALLFWWFATRRGVRHTIASNGIVTSNRLYRWEDVRCVLALEWADTGNCDLGFEIIEERSPTRNPTRKLALDPRLTKGQCNTLFERLRQEIGAQYPHVKIGGFRVVTPT